MPQLQVPQEKLEKFYLPSTQNETDEANKAWVVLDIAPLVTGDMLEVEKFSNQVEISLDVLVTKIRDWNYSEADGSKSKIDMAHLKLLDIGDYMFLTAQLNGGKAPSSLTTAEKKS